LIADGFNKEIFDFIEANTSSDPYELSLRSKHFSSDIRKLISNQVLSRQKAGKKIPEWMAYDQIIWPGPESIEQASSDITAQYKSKLVHGGILMDLTGGLGVDTYYFAKKVEKVKYVEKDEEVAGIASYNFNRMGVHNVEVSCRSAEEAMHDLSGIVDYIYLDPSRRVKSGRVFKLEDAEPNLLKLQEALLSHAKLIIVKASPYLDLSYAFDKVKKIKEIHILAVENECKEVLLLSGTQTDKANIKIVTINYMAQGIQTYQTTYGREHKAICDQATSGRYIYDPNAAIRKAGLFRSLCVDFGLKKLSNNSHVYFGNTLISNFPGRVFEMVEIIPYRRFMKRGLFDKANIAVRNFPLTVAEIREKTRIREGGDTYIFGTSDQNMNSFFIICQKVRQIQNN
jgi:hypothetical protein